ncbi:dihydroneopterin aldolase [Sneathiella glossodoripedis]|uniref:dihydroneopterin aldolase n=1 Tax=Sneathiella glossodoripedis TaxID=418853 RepID=UPI0004708AED|nr:dihydroneopterin aldolase [Sneathiella glossodoripedis]
MSTSEPHKITSLPLAETDATTHEVFINDLLVNMLIGVYEHEKLKEQPVRLNIVLTVRDHIGPINDDYHNVVCYETIAKAIKKLVKEEHINLVETLAEKVADICLKNQRTVRVRVKVEKLQALADAGSVGVVITRNRR